MNGQPPKLDLDQPVAPISVLRRTAYLIISSLFFVLAVAGILIPGLPTTPFLLLTSYFLLRSSPRLNQRLLDSKWFGPILCDWQHKGGIRKSVQTKTLLLMAVVSPTSIWLAPVEPPIKIFIGLLAIVGIAVVLQLPIVSDDDT